MLPSDESIQPTTTSIVFPCFNEEQRILPTLERVVVFLEGRGRPWEVLIVDDGSSDATAEVVTRRFGAMGPVRVLRHERNRGKGFAVCAGVLASHGGLVLFSDADLSTPIEELAKLEEAAADGGDLVVASRVIPGARIRTPQPALRRLSARIFRLLVHALDLSSLQDTQCGFKLMRRATVEPILRRMETQGFAFDVELIARCERAGLHVVEVPVEWRDVRGSRVRLYPDALRMAWDLLRLRRRLGPGAGNPPPLN